MKKFEKFEFNSNSPRPFPNGPMAGIERLMEAIGYGHLIIGKELKPFITTKKVEELNIKNANIQTWQMHKLASALLDGSCLDGIRYMLKVQDPKVEAEFFIFKDDDIWWFSGDINYLLSCFERSDVKIWWDISASELAEVKKPNIEIEKNMLSTNSNQTGISGLL